MGEVRGNHEWAICYVLLYDWATDRVLDRLYDSGANRVVAAHARISLRINISSAGMIHRKYYASSVGIDGIFVSSNILLSGGKPTKARNMFSIHVF